MLLTESVINRFGNKAERDEQAGETYLRKTRNCLYMAKMWLGKLLGTQGGENPYPHSSNPASPVIEKETDCYNEGMPCLTGLEYVPCIKELRRQVSQLLKRLAEDLPKYMNSREAQLYYDQVFLTLTEARLWLGAELGEVRSLTVNAAPHAFTDLCKKQDNGIYASGRGYIPAGNCEGPEVSPPLKGDPFTMDPRTSCKRR